MSVNQDHDKNESSQRVEHAFRRSVLLSLGRACMSGAACAALAKVQGGTGKHIDGSIGEPLQARPFQALVHLSDPDILSAPSADGSLQLLPGFHGAAARYFQLAGIPSPEGGFTPLAQHEELSDESLWVPARRLPSRWMDLHAKGGLPPPSGAAQARSIDGLVKRLRGLASELRDATFGTAEPPHAGDYTIWDPRLPHTTGEPDTFNGSGVARQVLYCAFMLAQGNEGLAAEQRECRQTGRHMRWAPSSQRDDEMRAEYTPSLLTSLGKELYGYSHGGKARIQPRERAAAAAKAIATEQADWADAEADAPSGTAAQLTDAHVAFFVRYGYVVVEEAVARDLALRVAADVRAYMRSRHGLDVDDLAKTLSIERLRRAFSPDGSGMLEVYWLQAMEEARQTPSLINITRRLYARTWASGQPTFRTSGAPVRPRLHYYVDRTSVRLPSRAVQVRLMPRLWARI